MISGKLGTLMPVGTYSKIGQEMPGAVSASHLSPKPVISISDVSTFTAEFLRLIENDWKNLAMDLTQLGLTVVGLLDVAPPVQAGADALNGSIDIARGHPWIGALSIASATPLAGLLSGVCLAGFRILKVVWSGFKAIGKTVYVLVTFATKPAFRFVVTRGKKILSYLSDTGKIVEGAKNVGTVIVDNIMSFAKKLAEINPKYFEPITSKPSVKTSPRHNPNLFQHNQQQIQHQVQSDIGKYRVYPRTYGNMWKGNMKI